MAQTNIYSSAMPTMSGEQRHREERETEGEREERETEGEREEGERGTYFNPFPTVSRSLNLGSRTLHIPKHVSRSPSGISGMHPYQDVLKPRPKL